MEAKDTNKYTFWDLISSHVIEIPIIQRDYAQGREFEKIEEIRNSFLDSLFNALDKNSNLDLDFIYGNLGEEGVFVPLDGQQRLTTLFLLHWYLAVKEKKIKRVYETLMKFTYETRTSSREFCNALAGDYAFFEDLDFGSIESISKEIKNAPWFFISWEKDPTIKAILVMLDAIHLKFRNCPEVFERLIDEDNGPVTFQFIKLENFGLEDSLYIKMNARGKPLTDFENFKARFEQLLSSKEENSEFPKGYAKVFADSIDGRWTDLFWCYRDTESNLFDDMIMNFFRGMVVNNYALGQSGSIPSDEQEKMLDYLINHKKHISFAKYSEYGCFDKTVIEDISITLDALSNGSNKIKTYLPDTAYIDENALFEKIIRTDKDYRITYTDRIQFYGLTQFFKQHRSNIDSDKLYCWMRVISNLSENTLYNNVGDFMRSIKGIREIIGCCSDILNYLTDHDNAVPGFLKEQVDEERVKAVLIQKDDKWKDAVIKAESHGYFKGQIGFILKFSGILNSYNGDRKLNWSAEEDDGYHKNFMVYFNKSSKVFNDRGLNVSPDLWRRALLCKGDYLLRSGRNLSFLIDSHRDISWKRLLRDDNDKRDHVKKLLDDLDVNDIDGSLENIIKNSVISDWRQYFIKNPYVMAGSGSGRYIRKDSNNDILLLNSTTTSGYNKEYYSYALYCVLCLIPGVNPEYVEDRGAFSRKYVRFTKNDEVEIHYGFINSKWSYLVKDGQNISYHSTQNDVLNYLRSQHYI